MGFYCGSNDLGRDKDTETVIANTLELFHRFHQRCPDAPVAYHGIIKAPEKQHRWDDVDTVNGEVKDFIRRGGLGIHIDLNPLFFTRDGESRMDRFVEDRLHLTDEAYQAMNDWCAPKLKTLLNPVETG